MEEVGKFDFFQKMWYTYHIRKKEDLWKSQ